MRRSLLLDTSSRFFARGLFCVFFTVLCPVHICPLHSPIQPARISHSEPTETSTHKNIPSNSGRWPTVLTVAKEIPLPIRNKVAVSPIFASFTAMAYSWAPPGRYVLHTAARQNSAMNHGHGIL